MSPRPYNLGNRKAAADQTRTGILTAARELLASDEALTGFTMDTVARRAGVARMTVYYQFGSKTGLLEALFDDLALRGGMDNMRTVFMAPDPRTAIERFVAVFGGFWASDRDVIRRVRALATLDPELGKGLSDRDARRHQAAQALLARLEALPPGQSLPASEEASKLLAGLTSFEFFDALTGTGSIAAEIPVVQRLCLSALGFVGKGSKLESEGRTVDP